MNLKLTPPGHRYSGNISIAGIKRGDVLLSGSGKMLTAESAITLLAMRGEADCVPSRQIPVPACHIGLHRSSQKAAQKAKMSLPTAYDSMSGVAQSCARQRITLRLFS